jgi:hypothetical protein
LWRPLALRARLLPHARSDDPVMQSVAAAVRRVEFGLRLVRATLSALCAALGYLAVFAVSVSQLGDGIDLARLKGIEASLRGEV